MSPTEIDLLDRILSGQLRLADEGVIEYFHRKRKTWYAKIPDSHPLSGRLRFRFGPRRCTVYRNRLVWMLTHRRAIPADHHVDHYNGIPTDDRPENLKLMPRYQSNSQGYAQQQQSVLEYLCRWFDFMGEYEREPQTPREVSWVEIGF